jgi:hypothetical protein
MAAILFLGGIFNKMFFGVPIFVWIMVFMLLLGIIGFALWFFFFWWKLKPYHGIFWAHLRKTGVSAVFDENMHFDWITDRSAKVIFAETFAQAQDAEDDHTEAPTATLGSVRGDFVFDPDKWTYPNSFQHKIIEDIAEKHNIQNPNDQVRTLLKFARYMDEGRFNEYADDLQHLKTSYIVPWSRIKMMYKDRDESGTFGFVMTLAKTIEDIQNESMNKYALLILGVFLVIDVVIIAAHYIH